MRPAFVLWIVEKLSCWAGRKQCPLFLPLKFPDLHGEDVDDLFSFFFCNPLMQSSVIVEITAGPLSGTTARGGSEEGPVLTGIEPWILTPQRLHCAWLWDSGKDPVTLPLYGSEEQSLILLSAQCYQWDLFLLFFFNHGPNCPLPKVVSMQSPAGTHCLLINYTIAGRSGTLFCPVTIFKVT